MLMLHFKSRNDLGQLPSSDPAYTVIKALVDLTITPYDTPDRPYDPDAEGWIVLIREGDLVGPLTDIWDDTSLQLSSHKKKETRINNHDTGFY
jgi:hypothetical protein